MGLKEHLKLKKRKRIHGLAKVTTQEDLLRAILENLEFANRINILQMQYLLLETNQVTQGVRRVHRAQLAETIKKLLYEATEDLT